MPHVHIRYYTFAVSIDVSLVISTAFHNVLPRLTPRHTFHLPQLRGFEILSRVNGNAMMKRSITLDFSQSSHTDFIQENGKPRQEQYIVWQYTYHSNLWNIFQSNREVQTLNTTWLFLALPYLA